MNVFEEGTAQVAVLVLELIVSSPASDDDLLQKIQKSGEFCDSVAVCSLESKRHWNRSKWALSLIDSESQRLQERVEALLSYVKGLEGVDLIDAQTQTKSFF